MGGPHELGRIMTEFVEPAPAPSAPPKPTERKIVRLRDSLRSSSFRIEVKSYFQNSSIHGVKYVIEKHRPNFERLIWTITLSASMILAGYYTEQVWNTTPILFREKAVHEHYRVPLPAITICSNAKVSRKSTWGEPKTANKDRHTLRYICGEAFPNSRAISVERLSETAALFDNTCTLDIREQDGQNLTQQNCREMFQKVVTEQGICYTFNGYHPRDMYRDDVLLGEVNATSFGFKNSSFGETEGRQLACGDWPGGELLMNWETPGPGVMDHLKCGGHILKVSLYSGRDDTGYCTFRNTTGFKLIVHNPKEVPIAGVRRLIWTREEDNEQHSIDLKTESKVTVKVEAKITTHTNDLLWFNPTKRKCYAENERYLRFFKTYTKDNCMIECIANKTKELCECADFFMPRDKDTAVCKRVHLPCIFDVIDLFRKKSANYCDCFPSCYRLEYIPQTRVIPDVKESNWNDTSLTVKVEKNVTETEFYPSFSDVQVIAQGGGVYGFFCGLSLISLVEIVYFFCIRGIGNYYKESKPVLKERLRMSR